MTETYRGIIDRADARGVYVQIPDLGYGVYGPMEVVVPDDGIAPSLVVGARVLVQQVSNIREDLMLLGLTQRYDPDAPPGGGGSAQAVYYQPEPPDDLEALWVDSDEEPVGGSSGGGGGGGGGGGATRQATTVTGATGDGTIVLALTTKVIKISTTAATRFRVYRTPAQRTADLARPFTTPADEGAVLADFNLDAGQTFWPNVFEFASDSTTYYTRTDGLATVTLTWEGQL